MAMPVKLPQPKYRIISEKIDWEQRYFDTALSALTGILSNYKFDELNSESFYKTNIVNTAIVYADELIKCYKKTI